MGEEQPEKHDHRPRVAQMRRERRRQQILSVVGAHYPGPKEIPATLDDILKVAGISKGTFYKYFPSLEDAVSAHGADLARQMILDMEEVYSPLSTPVERVAMGFQLFLYRGVSDRSFAAFTSHIQELPQDNLLLQYILADLREGRARGAFRITDVDNAAWICVGITFAALKRIAGGAGGEGVIRETVTMLLRALGAEEAAIAAALDKTGATLTARGPEVFSWWRTG
ncbi:TetR/AcrR family transcriptional regulator [Salipiger abyssi]|uniref:Transcriptional regulator n=1 Tax=Salipiger abyssi TaxID=1250539 RepID=A0A1P8UMG2_9RHOB|nr:TetR/AcrR family transcriptional regulator [Salipiger abyssi]APZ50555.1 transcriptional regulator [Salipiger abyssi]